MRLIAKFTRSTMKFNLTDAVYCSLIDQLNLIESNDSCEVSLALDDELSTVRLGGLLFKKTQVKNDFRFDGTTWPEPLEMFYTELKTKNFIVIKQDDITYEYRTIGSGVLVIKLENNSIKVIRSIEVAHRSKTAVSYVFNSASMNMVDVTAVDNMMMYILSGLTNMTEIYKISSRRICLWVARRDDETKVMSITFNKEKLTWLVEELCKDNGFNYELSRINENRKDYHITTKSRGSNHLCMDADIELWSDRIHIPRKRQHIQRVSIGNLQVFAPENNKPNINTLDALFNK